VVWAQVGLAKVRRRSGELSEVRSDGLGTFTYAAPEVLCGTKVGGITEMFGTHSVLTWHAQQDVLDPC
jgi:hypothetical protein